ncbi:MAG TPA: hypothetical protein VGG11_16140 [Xanthobacteraceae bacterium]|jgi:hypothetical protein
MAKVSKTYRDKAATELRESRKKVGAVNPAKSVQRAASYKELAANEEWLDGEATRSKRRPPKRR